MDEKWERDRNVAGMFNEFRWSTTLELCNGQRMREAQVLLARLMRAALTAE
jgi:hypothetical protein